MAGSRSITAIGTIDWNEGELRVLLSGPGGETSEEIQRRARAVQRRAQTAAPFRTGDLRSSISVDTTYPSEGAVADITAGAYYAGYVEFGRGAIDLTGTSHYLHWEGRDGGDMFRQKAGAVGATHFMSQALDEAGG